jgi:hypothetical protein
VFVGLAAPASAHHGLGRFDPTRGLTVDGTLTSLDFVDRTRRALQREAG